MAKKDRDNAEQDEKKGGLLTVIIVLVIIAIWIAIFALLVHLDIYQVQPPLHHISEVPMQPLFRAHLSPKA